ncbi:MAG TPA: hypothetical protein VIE66_21845 [Methylocella sp.]|jgi:hypothetical protein
MHAAPARIAITEIRGNPRKADFFPTIMRENPKITSRQISGTLSIKLPKIRAKYEEFGSSCAILNRLNGR